MINLCLVVIATQFSETKRRETERMAQERHKSSSASTLTTNDNAPGGCYGEILKYIAHLWRRGKRKLNRFYRHTRGKRLQTVTPEKAISLRRKRTKKNQAQNYHNVYYNSHVQQHQYRTYNGDRTPTAPRASPELSDIDPVSSPRRPHQMLVLPSSGNSQEKPSLSLSSHNHVATRAASFNEGQKVDITCPELLAICGTRHAAILAAAAASGADIDMTKLHPFLCK